MVASSTDDLETDLSGDVLFGDINLFIQLPNKERCR